MSSELVEARDAAKQCVMASLAIFRVATATDPEVSSGGSLAFWMGNLLQHLQNGKSRILPVNELFRCQYPVPPKPIGGISALSQHELAFGVAFAVYLRVWQGLDEQQWATVLDFWLKGGPGCFPSFEDWLLADTIRYRPSPESYKRFPSCRDSIVDQLKPFLAEKEAVGRLPLLIEDEFIRAKRSQRAALGAPLASSSPPATATPPAADSPAAAGVREPTPKSFTDLAEQAETAKHEFTGALLGAVCGRLGEATTELFSPAERNRAFFENAMDVVPYRAGVEVFLRPILADCGIPDATIQNVVNDAVSILHQEMGRMASCLSQLGFDGFDDHSEWSVRKYFDDIAGIIGADPPYSISDVVGVFDRARAWLRAEGVRQRLSKLNAGFPDRLPPADDVHHGTPEPTAPPPYLEKDDVLILESLARRKGIVAIQADIDLPKDRASGRLRYLATLKYVENPPGRKKRGWLITSAGIERLESLPAVDVRPHKSGASTA